MVLLLCKKIDLHLMLIVAEMEKGEEGGLRVVVVGGELSGLNFIVKSICQHLDCFGR